MSCYSLNTSAPLLFQRVFIVRGVASNATLAAWLSHHRLDSAQVAPENRQQLQDSWIRSLMMEHQRYRASNGFQITSILFEKYLIVHHSNHSEINCQMSVT